MATAGMGPTLASRVGAMERYLVDDGGIISRDRIAGGDADAVLIAAVSLKFAKDGAIADSGLIPASSGQVSFQVMERASMVRVNAGATDSGFKICGFCGFSVVGYQEWPTTHDDPLKQRYCGGKPSTFSLAHKYETDVLRITFPIAWGGENTQGTAQSVLHAVLQAAASVLQIAATNIDGAVSSYHTAAPTIDIVDTVPGGAGYSRIIAASLPAVLQGALQLVRSCECGPETSCYMCIRSFTNQRVHDQLSRGAAADYLAEVLVGREAAPVTVLAGTPHAVNGSDIATFDEWDEAVLLADARLGGLLARIRELGYSAPTVGLEVGFGGWPVECGWESEQIAIVTDEDPERDEWLEEERWRVIDTRGDFSEDRAVDQLDDLDDEE